MERGATTERTKRYEKEKEQLVRELTSLGGDETRITTTKMGEFEMRD